MKKIHQELLSFAAGGVLGLLVLVGALFMVGKDRVLPGVTVAGMKMGGMKREEVEQVVKQKWEGWELQLKYGESVVAVPKEVMELQQQELVDGVMRAGKSGQVQDLLGLVRGGIEVPVPVEISEEKYAAWVESLRQIVEIPGMPGEAELVGETVKINNGTDGVTLDAKKLSKQIVLSGQKLTTGEMELPVEQTRMTLTNGEVEELQTKLQQLVGDTLQITVDEAQVTLTDKELVALMAVAPGKVGEVDQEKVAGYLAGLAERYNREPQDARLMFEGGKVQEFAPARDGIEVNVEAGEQSIQSGIEELVKEDTKTASVEVPLSRTPPKVTTEEVNNLGIVERIGKGESYYAHSIPNRVYNVRLASERVSGTLVAPGAEFSFNQAVGEISSETGYKTAYVISNGRTELGDGGGVCQVSTTLFRAALDTGLPITERWAHAYRVGYYEQNAKPGLDATIYSPSKDLKFINDTPGHILIQAIVDEPNRHLTFEIYGTKDGRTSYLSPVRVWGESPPPPDLYQDDPTLPTGTVKQVDWAAWGAKASFDYRVEKGGETVFTKTFNSNFKPWANVYLRGTGPAQ